MEKVWFFLYTLIATLLYLIALPFLFLLSFKTKYNTSIPARFFLWRNRPLKSGGIWFHVCSYGEAKAVAPLVELLPQEQLRLSTTTQTGYEAIAHYSVSQSRYLPFEPLLFFWLKPQKALVVMEAEFWYLLFALAQKRGAKTVLVNARMSDRSYPKYLRMAWFYRHIFAHIDEVYAQTPLDQKRLESLGATNVKVTGNIKLSTLPSPSRRRFKPSGLLLCAASTHEGEEVLILEAFVVLREACPEARLLVVPRHPERFEKVALLMADVAKRASLSWHRFSQDETLEDDMVLVDTLGELVNLYAISDIVILGGAFEPIGGHNAAEAAQFGCKIISGKHYFNQVDIFGAIEGIAIVEKEDLAKELLQHTLLQPTKLTYRTDISAIAKSLKDVL